MKLLYDLFFTDYGFMSLIVIGVIIIAMTWLAVLALRLIGKG